MHTLWGGTKSPRQVFQLNSDGKIQRGQSQKNWKAITSKDLEGNGITEEAEDAAEDRWEVLLPVELEV